MNVLSTFDGMSCGQIALERAGKKVDLYLASEIDQHAIKVTQANYPKTKQLGDITKIRAEQLPKIDLLIGGSPCQGFSIAGKGLNFEDPRSALFFEFLRLLNELRVKNPEIKFLLENVVMKKEIQDEISRLLGVEPVLINSALVSAQRRNRLYWTNIDFNPIIEDRKIALQDILESSFEEKYVMGPGWVDWWNKNYEYQLKKQYCSVNAEKAITMTARQFASWNGNFIALEEKSDGLVFIGALKKGLRLNDGKILSRNFREGYRVYSIRGKSATLTSQSKGGEGGSTGLYGQNTTSGVIYRKLTPVECERLQTVPDNYTSVVSDTQRYKMLGNGWTVDVVAHIFQNL